MTCPQLKQFSISCSENSPTLDSEPQLGRHLATHDGATRVCQVLENNHNVKYCASTERLLKRRWRPKTASNRFRILRPRYQSSHRRLEARGQPPFFRYGDDDHFLFHHNMMPARKCRRTGAN